MTTADTITFRFEFSHKEIDPMLAEDDASAFCPLGWEVAKVDFDLWESSSFTHKTADGTVVRTITQWTTIVEATAVKCEA